MFENGCYFEKKKILLLPHCELWSKLFGFGNRNTNIVKWVLDFKLLFEINTMFKGGRGERIREWIWKNKTKKRKKERKGTENTLYV